MNDLGLMVMVWTTVGGTLAVFAAIAFAFAVLRAPIYVPIAIAVINLLMLIVPLIVNWLDNERGGRASISEVVSLLIFFGASLIYILGLGHALGTVFFRRRSRALAVSAPLLVYALIPVLIWGQSQLRTVFAPFSAHGDAAMLARFAAREPDLGRLAALFEEDGDLGYLCPNGQALWRYRNQTTSPERFAQYSDLFAATGVRYGVTRQFLGQIRLRYWAAAGGAYREKGYALLPDPPDELVESLDGGGFGRLAYRHISGPWYLYYYDSDSMPGPCI